MATVEFFEYIVDLFSSSRAHIIIVFSVQKFKELLEKSLADFTGFSRDFFPYPGHPGSALPCWFAPILISDLKPKWELGAPQPQYKDEEVGEIL